jgi:RluA family pseudouridine synthase
MDILIEDSSILVLNKPAGFIVEGPAKNAKNSLTSQLVEKFKSSFFPCHRLDRDATGILVFAKTKKALVNISKQFSDRKVRKNYLAKVQGNWNPAWSRVETRVQRTPEGPMENTNQGKLAITTFRRLAQWDGKSLIEALPKTGRTHQIRLHCLYHECPISGDTVYGAPSSEDKPMALHAWKLKFKHPETDESISIQAPLPDYWRDYWLLDCPVDIE